MQAPFPIQERRESVEKLWALSDQIVLINAGEPISIPGGNDQTFDFRVHPHFRWLSGHADPDCIVAFDPHSGWTEFVHQVSNTEKLWEGDKLQRLGLAVADLSAWLAARPGRQVAVLGAPIPGIASDAVLAQDLSAKLLTARRSKDPVEVALMQEAIRATEVAFAHAQKMIRPGVSERQIQIELEAEMFRQGADRTGYGSIVGSGPNAAVLHFSPSSRIVQSGEWVLIDAGAEVNGYVADVTRMFPADGAFSAKQQSLYDVVLKAQKAAIERCRPGTEWRQVHESTARDLSDGLRTLGVLTCSTDEAIASEAIALFFPHGVGHMVGLGVRDAGIYPGPANPRLCCGVHLRVDFPIERGYAMTIEPGIYFVPAILNNADIRDKFKQQVNWSIVDQWIGIGGVRIEDNVLVTDGDPINLTAAIPK